MTRLYRIHNLVSFLKTFCPVKAEAHLLPSSPPSLHFRIKWGCLRSTSLFGRHAISILHTSLKSHKNNYKTISAAFLKAAYQGSHHFSVQHSTPLSLWGAPDPSTLAVLSHQTEAKAVRGGARIGSQCTGRND